MLKADRCSVPQVNDFLCLTNGDLTVRLSNKQGLYCELVLKSGVHSLKMSLTRGTVYIIYRQILVLGKIGQIALPRKIFCILDLVYAGSKGLYDLFEA